MIISKTPLRIPFAGGLTDLKKYAKNYGGVTISTTIDKYIYVAIKKNVDGYINLKYKDVHEKVFKVEDVKNDIIREALILTKLDSTPVDLYIMTDINSESGLGSSGSLTVGLLNAMHTFKGEKVSVDQLVLEASHIEIDILDGASGFHDPAICAYGGMQLIEYDGTNVVPKGKKASPDFLETLEKRLLFFYNGRHYKTKPSLDLLNSQLDAALEPLSKLKEAAYEFERAVQTENFDKAGEMIQLQQTIKQSLPGNFVDDYVIDIVEKINSLGAYAQLPGGKIGSFIMVYCPEEKQNDLRSALRNFKEVKFGFSEVGTQVFEV